METASITSGIDLVKRFEDAVYADYADKVHQWIECQRALGRWEDENLIDTDPTPEILAMHEQMVKRLIFFGQVFTLAVSNADFPDTMPIRNIEATVWILREQYRMFHNPMSKEESDGILKEAFPES